jgi:formylglycine-generating enzyme required for sulfatase activity
MDIALGTGLTLRLVRVPAGEFVMGDAVGCDNERPLHRARIERPFWMATTEVTNEQYGCFDPVHQSGLEPMLWLKWSWEDYADLSQPRQPVCRVSWDEAMAFCRWLSGKTGRRITLPTEAQWEWACRAGAATPFSFGPLDADYSVHANLGDKQLAEFAADTALDNYTAARPMVNPNRYDDWIPRDDRFDDGGFVTEPVGRYQPNPWGLHDLHGNAWEWTRSAHRPYPYLDDDGRNALTLGGEERVVRGGSWYDRPKRCTASFRLSYPPWQRVFNVGFRVVCDDVVETAGRSGSGPNQPALSVGKAQRPGSAGWRH